MVIRFKSIFNLFTLSALMLSLLGSALTFTPAYAANITVDTSADENNTGASCSLREAIIAANTDAAYGGCLAGSGSGTDTIAFADNYTITLSLGSQLPLVTTTISIKGNGATNTIVRANAAANTVTYRVFEVGGAGILTLSGLTVSNGVCLEACGGGGGVYNAGTLSASNVTFSANSASNGGGIYNSGGTLTLLGVNFNSNSASSFGGGIFNDGGINSTLTNITFSANSASNGAGMFNESSSPTLTKVTFSANAASIRGGGMYNSSSSPTLTNVTFSTNSAVNAGGGMNNEFTSNPTLTNSTFNANTAGFGGGMSNDTSSPTLINVTFSGNIAGKTNGGGMFNNDNSSPTLKNTLIANSGTSGDCKNDSTSSLNVASTNNLLESAGTACSQTNGVNGNIIGSDPNLGTLTGSPAHFPLNSGSPAIDTGDNAICAATPVNNTSQNGIVRPQGNRCDIGSYEFDPLPAVLSSIRVSANPTSAASVDFTVTFSESVTGVDLTDFSLTSSGVSSPAVSGLSGTGSSYTVSVNTGTGAGKIRLDVLDDNTIIDLNLNPLSAGFTSGQVYTVRTTTFTDVPTSYWAWQYIERLASAGVTGGCGTGIYCPDATVTRAQMAVFLLKGIHGSSYTPPAVGLSTGFGDVPVDAFAAAFIKQLAAEGVTSGCGNGNYCPDSVVTRAQMAIFLLKAKNGSSYSPPAVGVSTGFNDVATDAFAAAFIKQLVADGITAGCGNSNYCPNDSVTRAQMAVFLVRAFNLP